MQNHNSLRFEVWFMYNSTEREIMPTADPPTATVRESKRNCQQVFAGLCIFLPAATERPGRTAKPNQPALVHRPHRTQYLPSMANRLRKNPAFSCVANWLRQFAQDTYVLLMQNIRINGTL
jgi:hypothetical protein